MLVYLFIKTEEDYKKWKTCLPSTRSEYETTALVVVSCRVERKTVWMERSSEDIALKKARTIKQVQNLQLTRFRAMTYSSET